MRIRDSQVRLLQLIQDFRDRCGYSPSYRDINDLLGTRSTNGVACRLHWLEKKGLIDSGVLGAARQTRLTVAGLEAIGRVERISAPYAAEMAEEELGL